MSSFSRRFSCKSIVGCSEEVSVHEMACCFNLLHFWGQTPGDLEEDAHRPPENLLSERERIAEVVRGRLALPPTNPGQTSTRMGAHPIAISILEVSGEVTVYQLTCHFISLHSVMQGNFTPIMFLRDFLQHSQLAPPEYVAIVAVALCATAPDRVRVRPSAAQRLSRWEAPPAVRR